MQKPADTQYAIHDLLKNRWSPRAFSSRPIEPEKLISLFEAARWSPSAGNSQPWSFVVATHKNLTVHEKLVATMTGNNPRWAQRVPVLILALARTNPEKPEANPFAYYDLGQAVAHLTIQAAALGLDVHQMGGFDRMRARELFEIPDGYDLMTVIAVGYPGDPANLPDDLRDRELLPRTRKPVSEIAFQERWNQPISDETAAAAGD